MQANPKEFNQAIHDKFKALSVWQPFPDYIKTGEKTIELRNQNTSYRGDILICSTSHPIVPGHESGVSICLVELYGTKPVKDLTPEEIEKTKAESSIVDRYKTGFGWLLRNPRPVIEFPVKGQLGLFNLVYSKDCIIPYPINKFKFKEPEVISPRKKQSKLRRFWLALIRSSNR
jgi:hypothetical protein